MSLCCRICEGKNVSKFKNIFEHVKMIEKLNSCATIQLDENDELPKIICNICENNLNLAYDFRVTCETTDAKLRKQLIPNNPLKELHDLGNNSPLQLEVMKIEIVDEKPLDIDIDIDIDIKKDSLIQMEKEETKMQSSIKTSKLHMYHLYKCDTCELQLDKRKDYIIHIRSHGKQRFQCKICSHWCPCKTKLKMHLNEVHNRNCGSICELCGKTFSNPRNLQRHIVDYHEQRKPYKCETCGLYFARTYILNQHCSTVHSNLRNWKCNECQKTFKIEAHLKLHKKQNHLPEGERLIRKKKFYKKVECPECGKLCQSNGALKDHLRWHTGEKPYQCTICGKAFALKNALYRHDMVHKGVKPYKCDICQMTFRQTNHLSIHKLTHTGEKPHQCDFCERAFATKGNLTAHRKLHLGIKNTRGKKELVNTIL